MKKLLLFDFDGVLVNTVDIGYEMNKPLINDLTREEYLNLFRGNVYAEAEKFKARETGSNFDADGMYRDYLVQMNSDQAIEQLIRSLASHYKMSIISSSLGSSIESFLRKHELRNCFNLVLGYEAGPTKVEKIKHVLENEKVSAPDAIFITDTLGDLRECAKAGIRAIAVTWGFHDRATLEEGSPTAIVSTLAELELKIYELLN